MLILVISDSHNIIHNLNSVLAEINSKINLVIHLGDGNEDIEHVMKKYRTIDYYTVRGNCDINSNLPNTKLITVCSKNIFITHGHLFNVKQEYNNIVYAARAHNADICFFGHSHIPIIFEKENTLFMNPGSISIPRFEPNSSYGLCEIDSNGHVNLSINYV